MGEGRQRAQDGRVADQDIEPSEALVERRTERVDGRAVGEVEWD